MSSNILSEEYDMRKFGLVFSGAQKNMGIAGVCVVIIRQDLLQRSPDSIPDMLNYRIQHEKESMLNTPPVFAVYVLNLVLKWIEANGGVEDIARINKLKAKMLYDYIDNSAAFSNNISDHDRSLMNVIFTLPTEEENKEFVAYAQKKGLMFLKGHRSVGGLRASIYNAAPLTQVEALLRVMQQYERERQ
jgi:phosphoserine aminotransferase